MLLASTFRLIYHPRSSWLKYAPGKMVGERESPHAYPESENATWCFAGQRLSLVRDYI